MTDWLLGTLLATSGLIILVLVVREPVRRRFGARVAYGLWLIPAARLLMPTLTETVERPVQVSAPPRFFTAQLSTEPMLLSSVAAPEPSLIDQLGGWPTILVLFWLGIGLGLFAARMAAFHRERKAILARATQIATIGSIRLVRSPEVSGPLAFGIFDRVIAVPEDFDRLYAPHERRLALDHELAHHRSGDLIANIFAFVLLCLQWFNPLAWVAHAAFRFDQEAACDARVLDKAKAQDRADYGRAIAKAASGRALLFASALDRRKTLHRRLISMLSNPSSGRRLAGRVMVLAAIAITLPLTATRAINYVDVAVAPEPAGSSDLGPLPEVAPVAPVAPASQVAAVAPVAPVAPINVKQDGRLIINGVEREWSDLSPAERAEIRRSIAKAKDELARARIDRGEIQREIREAMAEARIDQAELRRELAQAQAEIDRAMREVDSEAAAIRRSGQDPEQIKATIRQSLEAVRAIDVEAISRQAMASVNPEAIAASVAAAEQSLAKAKVEMEALERRLEQEE